MSIWDIVNTKLMLAMIIQITLWIFPLYGFNIILCINLFLLNTQILVSLSRLPDLCLLSRSTLWFSICLGRKCHNLEYCHLKCLQGNHLFWELRILVLVVCFAELRNELRSSCLRGKCSVIELHSSHLESIEFLAK